MSSTARSIEEVSDPLANFMLNPALPGPGICSVCWTFQDPAYGQCYKCGWQPGLADVVVPITYSVGQEQMHYVLRRYKDGATAEVAARFQLQLAAVLWRFLRAHETCVAAAAGVHSFDRVTVVPSATVARDDARPRLRQIVGQIVGQTAERFDRLLAPTDSTAPGHQYDENRFRARRPLGSANVLLIDDTWTTGASVQAAASALKAAGACRVAVVVIGRHVNRDFADHAERIRTLSRPFDWSTCAVHQTPINRSGPVGLSGV